MPNPFAVHQIPIRMPKALPDPPYYLMILFRTQSVDVPGDERSRTHPGHGYPGETKLFETPEIRVYRDVETLTADMQILYNQHPGRDDVAALHVDRELRPTTSFALVPDRV